MPSTKSVLKELQAVEAEVGRRYKQLQEEFKESSLDYYNKREALLQRRQELVAGKPPTAEELGEDAAANAAASTGVPRFWLSVLCNQDTLAELITPRDRLALAYLTNITVKGLDSSSSSGPVVEFNFKTNPYFNQTLLRRGLGGGEGEGGDEEVATVIKWKAGQDLTVKEVKGKKGGGGGSGKKGKKGAKGAKQGSAEGDSSAAASAPGPTRVKPCPSFFRFFAHSSSVQQQGGKGPGGALSRKALADLEPSALLEALEKKEWDGEEEEPGLTLQDEAVSAKLAGDREVLGVLLEEVLPAAYRLFMAGPLQSPAASSDDEGAEEGDFAMVHGGGASLEDLPPGVGVALQALEHNQGLLDKLRQDWRGQRLRSAQQHKARLTELYQKRRSLLLAPDGKSSTIPCYWLHVLRGTDTGALGITRRDGAVLAWLADVRYSVELPLKPTKGPGETQEVAAKLELEFFPGSPHLSNSSSSSLPLLVKTYALESLPSSSLERGEYPFALRSSRVTAGPSWVASDKDPTHKRDPGAQAAAAAAAAGGGGGKAAKGRLACSFFHLFRQGGGKWAFNLTGDDKHAQEEANILELEFLGQLEMEVLPASAKYYNDAVVSGAVDDDGWGSTKAFEEESEDEDEAEEHEEEDGEAAAAARAARKAMDAKHSGFKITKRTVLVGLLLMVLVGEMMLFLLQLSNPI